MTLRIKGYLQNISNDKKNDGKEIKLLLPVVILENNE